MINLHPKRGYLTLFSIKVPNLENINLYWQIRTSNPTCLNKIEHRWQTLLRKLLVSTLSNKLLISKSSVTSGVFHSIYQTKLADLTIFISQVLYWLFALDQTIQFLMMQILKKIFHLNKSEVLPNSTHLLVILVHRPKKNNFGFVQISPRRSHWQKGSLIWILHEFSFELDLAANS